MSGKKKEQDIIFLQNLSLKKIGLTIAIIIFFLVFLITLFIYKLEVDSERSALYSNEENRIKTMEEFTNSTLQSVLADLYVISTQEELSSFFVSNDTSHLDSLSNEYLEIAIAKKVYDQIRYIDENGTEQIRINYNDGGPYIVDYDNLQSKKGRYYFENTNSLNRNEIFLSPLDLNIENGEIEQPLKPMLRFGMALFNEAGERKGITLINYLADEMLSGMEQFYFQDDGELLMFNQDGYFIKAINEEDQWGFMYENIDDKTAQNINEELWKKTQESTSGQFETAEGLYTYTKIFPLHLNEALESGNNNDYSWTVISFIENEKIAVTAKSLLFKMLIIDSILLFGIFLLIWKLAISMRTLRKAEKNIIELNDLLGVINKILRHDILGKLGGIRAALEFTELTEKNKDVKVAYDHVLESIHLIKQMKDLELGSFKNKKLKKYAIRPLLKALAKEHDISIKIHGSASVLADEAISSVFENLIRNAKIHAEVDNLDIKISRDNKSVEIRIADSGKGIPKKIKNKIFNEGFTSGASGNTGLGLFIVKKTIERYDGSVHCEDNCPKGTIFVVNLPLQ